MRQIAKTTMTTDDFSDACADAERFEASVFAESLNECRDVLRAGVAENFARQGSASGSWPPRRDQGNGHPLLNDNGTLKDAATSDGPGSVSRVVDGCELQVGVAVGESGSLAGAAVHQYGATIRPKTKKMLSWINSSGQRVFAKQVKIPARPYMEVGSDVIDECCEIIADHLAGAVF
jgi:phage gpG-like protein